MCPITDANDGTFTANGHSHGKEEELSIDEFALSSLVSGIFSKCFLSIKIFIITFL